MTRSQGGRVPPERLQELLHQYGDRIRNEGWSRADIMEHTGLGEYPSRRLLALAHGVTPGKRIGPVRRQQAAQEPAAKVKVTTTAHAQQLDFGPTRLKDPTLLLEQAGVDLTAWEIERATVSSWDMGSVPRRVGNDKEGWSRESTAPQITELFSVKITLKRRKDTLDIQQFKADALAEVAAAAAPVNRRVPVLTPPKVGRQLLYMGAHDVHVGKLALALETGQDYRSDLARELALSSVEALLLEAGPQIERIVLPVGHDLAHFENGSYGTSSGTPQDPDGRYRIMRRAAYQLMVDLAEFCAQVAPVDVIGVPGNHGRDTDLMIAEQLEARFTAHPNIRVQVPLTPRAYYRYGQTLLGLTHGDRIKHATLPLIMADEMREAWAETTHREWLLGHLHAKQAFQFVQTEAEYRSVRVRVLPSISATDYWHAVCGYSNLRAMEAYRYDFERGYVGHHSVTVQS